MSLIVETGTSDPNAESYVSVVQADLYHTNIGNANWLTMLTVEKEQALRRALAYMTAMYRLRWQGYRTMLFQGLDWPRWNVLLTDSWPGRYLPSTVMPQPVMDAQCDYAILAAAGDLDPVLSQNIISKQVGTIKVVYDQSSTQQKRYTAIESKMQIYFAPASRSSNLVTLNRC